MIALWSLKIDIYRELAMLPRQGRKLTESAPKHLLFPSQTTAIISAWRSTPFCIFCLLIPWIKLRGREGTIKCARPLAWGLVMVESGKAQTCDAKVQGSIPSGFNLFFRYIDVDRWLSVDRKLAVCERERTIGSINSAKCDDQRQLAIISDH